MPDPEAEISAFVSSLTYEDIPAEARETIRRAFLDTVGVILAGAESNAGAIAYDVDEVDPPANDALRILGLSNQGSAMDRALRVGTASHALDYDDLSWAIDGHPSVTLVPPLLSVLPDVAASGTELVTAYAAGFEVESALARPISPDHYEMGWHATATFGTFGATAAVASLLDLDEDETRNALTIAASMPAGLKRNFGSMTKPLHAGLCARSGVTAASLASKGFTADATAVSGEDGFWDLYSPTEREAFDLQPEEWSLLQSGIDIKYYPACYFTHTSIAATQTLTAEHDIAPTDIERIRVRASRGARDALQHSDPTTGLEAKFSMEYSVAAAAVRDSVGLRSYEDERIDDPDVQSVRERVDFTVDEDLPYDSHEAIVRIDTVEGSVERHQRNPPGTHENPLTDDELRAKFDECATRTVSERAAEALASVLLTLDDYEDVPVAIRDAIHH